MPLNDVEVTPPALPRLGALRRIIGTLLILLLGSLLGLTGLWAYGRYQRYLQDQINFGVVVRVIQYNLDQGILRVPPELAKTPPPAPAPAPAPPAQPPVK